MTRKFVVSVFDSAVQAYAPPIVVPALGVAIRSFGDEVKRKAEGNQLAAHPEDFELRVLSEWDEETGVFYACDVRCVARGKDYAE